MRNCRARVRMASSMARAVSRSTAPRRFCKATRRDRALLQGQRACAQPRPVVRLSKCRVPSPLSSAHRPQREARFERDPCLGQSAPKQPPQPLALSRNGRGSGVSETRGYAVVPNWKVPRRKTLFQSPCFQHQLCCRRLQHLRCRSLVGVRFCRRCISAAKA